MLALPRRGIEQYNLSYEDPLLYVDGFVVRLPNQLIWYFLLMSIKDIFQSRTRTELKEKIDTPIKARRVVNVS